MARRTLIQSTLFSWAIFKLIQGPTIFFEILGSMYMHVLCVHNRTISNLCERFDCSDKTDRQLTALI